MNTENLVNTEQLVIVGIDWADTNHVFHLIDLDKHPLTGDVKQDPKAIDDLRMDKPPPIARPTVRSFRRLPRGFAGRSNLNQASTLALRTWQRPTASIGPTLAAFCG